MSRHKLLFTLDKAHEVADEFLRIAKPHKQFAFYGPMGAGKTTFITQICQQLKALDIVSSPTFAIVNEYDTEPGDIIYHFDFYRIKTPGELFDIGFEEYCTKNDWCFIEWPEKAESLMPEDIIKVTITVIDDNQREISFQLPG